MVVKDKASEFDEATLDQPLDLHEAKSPQDRSQNQISPTATHLSAFSVLQSRYGNATVARMMIQRKEGSEGGTSVPSEVVPALGDASAAVAPPVGQGLIVEDNAETIAPGQMKKSLFLTQMRSAVTSTVTKELADSPLSMMATPYIERTFAQYAAQDGAQLERTIRRYAPEAVAVTNANSYIPIVSHRVRRSLATGGGTEGVPLALPGEEIAGAVGAAASGIASGVGSAVSTVGNLFFKEQAAGARVDSDPQVIQSKLDVGQSLDAGVRDRMESALGANFGDVQIHADTNAAGLAENLNARAFTVGQHIAFGRQEYQPGTLVGDALIAHELAHVLQQRGAGTALESKQSVNTNNSALEDDADRVAVGAVVSAWGGVKKGLAEISDRALPSLKSGLRLQRCSKSSSGPIGTARLGSARTNFQAKNSHLTPDELGRIDAGLGAVTRDNLNLWIAFYDYYSNHQITKMNAAASAKAMARGLYAETRPNSDTIVRDDLLAPTFPVTKLGSTLIHEFTHTRHDTNYMGTRDYQEGESYGVEYFLAERAGDTTRTGEISNVMSRPETLTIPALVPALLSAFRSQYAVMQGLYEIIDTGRSTHPGSPFVTPALLTADDARALVAELVSTSESNRSARLQSLLTWAKSHLTSFTGIPPV